MWTSRRRKISDLIQATKDIKVSPFVRIIWTLAFIYILSFLVFLLSFFMSREPVSIGSFITSFQGGWGRFFLAIAIEYLIAAATLFFFHVFPPSPDDSAMGDTALLRSSSTIYLIAICTVVTVPLYAFNVYAYLPQQIGGGQIIPVSVNISNNAISALVGNPDVETYLIDRTSSSTIFLLENKNGQSYRIIEISQDLIQTVTYSQSP